MASGGNPVAAGLAGVSVTRTRTILFVATGTAAGLAAIMLASRLANADPNVGTSFAFDVIVAVILGGTSFAGGEGGIFQTVIGVFVLEFLQNGLNLAGISGFWQEVATGALLIGAVMLDASIRHQTGRAFGRGPAARRPEATGAKGLAAPVRIDA
jgi:ribose/xylose/arabinose/galactoside ABC-type transport system permease subunit